MTRTVLAVALLAALVGAAGAGAADQPVPAGFAANAQLSRAASWVAGKPVTDYCASSVSVFETANAAATQADVPGADAFSWVGGTQSFLHPSVCAALTHWSAGQKIDPDALAEALLAVGHEAELLSGVSDESIADCKALAVLPRMVARFFPLRKRLSLHVLMGDAWDAHDGAPDQYLTNCPTR